MTILREALRFYLQAQLALIPLALIYLFYLKGRIKLQLQWIIHRILLIGSLVLPLFFLLPTDRVISFDPLATRIVPASQVSDWGEERILFSSAVSPVGDRVENVPSGAGFYLSDHGIELRRLAAVDFLGSHSSRIADLFLLLSAGGLVSFFGSLLRQRIRERIIMSQEGREGRNPTALEGGDVKVIISSRITIPYATGLIKKRVFLPASVPASGKISAMILEHELNHIQCGDLWWTLLEVLLARLFWYNPLVHLLKNEGVMIRELLCDSVTARSYSKASYARTLVAVATEFSGAGSFLASGVCLRGEVALVRRIRWLFKKPYLVGAARGDQGY